MIFFFAKWEVVCLLVILEEEEWEGARPRGDLEAKITGPNRGAL